MAVREDQPDPLYVVHDDDQIVVALDMPGVSGAVEERAYGAFELVQLYPVSEEDESRGEDPAISVEPPGLRSVKAWYGVGAVVGLSTGAVVTGLVSLGLGLPLTLATVVMLAVGYRRRRAVVSEAWRHRHRVLHHAEDTDAFTTARQAAERVVKAWPEIGAMVGVADPGPALARSLWTLSEVLVSRGALRDQRDELARIRTDLPSDTPVSREVDDRVAELDTGLSAFDSEVDARLTVFTELAERCERYVREQRATTRARAALVRADQALDDTPAPADDVLDPGRELAARTAAVLDAYQELTRHTPSL